MKRTAAFILTALLCFATVQQSAYAKNIKTENDIKNIAQGIINWKKLDNGSTTDGYLINDKFLELAGTTPGDWFPIGLGRLGVNDDYAAYLAVIKDVVKARYEKKGKLSSVKATEWHRISLAVLAMGGDPTNMGSDNNNQTINLIADGTYNRGKTVSLGKQGINGWIWGLISLDAKRYSIPSDGYYSRDDIISQILSQQLSDGGFALSGSVSDPDITAMALQALAPYYNTEKSYTYTQKAVNRQVTKTVWQVIDESLNWLSAAQLNGGDYKSHGTENAESTCQVAVALCSLGINPQQDSRFIKNGNTIVDGILKYRMQDGGFVHSFSYDPENPSSLPNQSNTMASEQALYTMAAIIRQMKGQRRLYDFRPEQSSFLKNKISSLINKINGISESTDSAVIKSLADEYNQIPVDEQCYVSNYRKLSDLAKQQQVAIHTPPENTQTQKPESPTSDKTDTSPTQPPNPDEANNTLSPNQEENTPLLFFSQTDKDEVESLPQKLSTEHYVLVVKLLDKLQQSEDFEEKQYYLDKLSGAKQQIADIQAEIDSINAEIAEKLYPFERISIKDKSVIEGIVNRYNALSAYDQAKINRWEDVIKTKTKVDNLIRAIIISVICIIVCAVVTIITIKSIKKRRNAKTLAMEELAAQYEDVE